uniref:Reverse transcriptase n=1 Tax=Chenopodium quinoa TaxID=63459 RepID=A0A803NBQ8_CHEQI
MPTVPVPHQNCPIQKNDPTQIGSSPGHRNEDNNRRPYSFKPPKPLFWDKGQGMTGEWSHSRLQTSADPLLLLSSDDTVLEGSPSDALRTTDDDSRRMSYVVQSVKNQSRPCSLIGRSKEKGTELGRWVNLCPVKRNASFVAPLDPSLPVSNDHHYGSSKCLQYLIPFKKRKGRDDSGCCGVDDVGLSGGLFIFWLAPFTVIPLFISPNFEVCKIVVGDAVNFVVTYPNTLLIGEFNQVEYLSNKVGGSSLIPRRLEFIQWLLDLGLVDVPFSGPSYTWKNNRIEVDPTFEILDRAYATQDWFIDFLDSIVHHQQILFLDHAAIIFSDSMPRDNVRRPYRIENWCLFAQDISVIIKKGCLLQFAGLEYNLFSSSSEGSSAGVSVSISADWVMQCSVQMHRKMHYWRLRWVLPSLVSGSKNAFVPGRLISDNALVDHELLSFTNASKARKHFYAALKLDMNKTYDIVRWDFYQVLRAFGFPHYWVHIIE